MRHVPRHRGNQCKVANTTKAQAVLGYREQTRVIDRLAAQVVWQRGESVISSNGDDMPGGKAGNRE